MDLMLSLSRHCSLEGGLAQRSAPGCVVGGGGGGGGVGQSSNGPARAQTETWLQSQIFLESVAWREAWHSFLPFCIQNEMK